MNQSYRLKVKRVLMKNVYRSFLILLIGGQVSLGQSVVSDSIYFGTTNEVTLVMKDIVVFNRSASPKQVIDIDFFEMYRDVPFTISDTSFTILPGDTHRVPVSFLPAHNLNHNMVAVLKTASGYGDIRVNLVGQGTYSNAYYQTTKNKVETQLKTALKAKISSGYNSLGYSTARDNMYGTLDNNSGTVTCVYTGRTANFNTRAGANSNSFNCEHTFPQGKFSSNEPMKSDIHHLFPTDVAANSQRGNDPFGMVGSSTWSQGGSKSGGSKFEPRNVQKGITARAMMYFVLRYQDYTNFFQSQETVLRDWHGSYPPLMNEITRNNGIFGLQNNRNPFVDYPQFADRITSLVTSAMPSGRSLYLSADTIKLASGAGRYSYRFTIYNNGSEPVNLSSFALSDTSLKFVQSTTLPSSLNPREWAAVDISFNAAQTYQASLTFNTNIAGSVNQAVFINSSGSVDLEESYKMEKVYVFPNPSYDEFNLSVQTERISKMWLLDNRGVRYDLPVKAKFDLSTKPAGVYWLQLSLMDGVFENLKLVVLP